MYLWSQHNIGLKSSSGKIVHHWFQEFSLDDLDLQDEPGYSHKSSLGNHLGIKSIAEVSLWNGKNQQCENGKNQQCKKNGKNQQKWSCICPR